MSGRCNVAGCRHLDRGLKGVSIRAVEGAGVSLNYSQGLTLVIWKGPVFAFEEECPEVDVGDIDGWVIGGNGHPAGK